MFMVYGALCVSTEGLQRGTEGNTGRQRNVGCLGSWVLGLGKDAGQMFHTKTISPHDSAAERVTAVNCVTSMLTC